jgi:hypothetical protein
MSWVGQGWGFRMRLVTKLGGIIAPVMLTLTMLGAAPAQAAVASHVSIRWDAMHEDFHGVVTSGNHECVAHRTVKVFKQTTNGPTLVGKTSSNKKGHWKVGVMAHSGKYFAQVPAQTIMTTHCAKARSTTVDVM